MARISRVSLTDFTAPGSLFDGKFLVERELGRGGMGSVLLVRHPELGTRVALKVMLPEHATDERLVERFLREGRATARLSSEHVARVFDAGRHADGFPYLVMEFLAGYTLHDRLARGGPLGVPAAVDLLLQACEGVAHAHAAGIVHRDLKPANLFLVPRPDGSVCLKVLDFGIAKDVGGANPMTATAESFGSPEYMSPEQIRAAKTVDPRSDVWALGVVLFEMLTGRVPFESASVFEVASKILGEAPLPVGALRPDAPPGLQAALATCLEKSPQRRFQGVGQLAAAIAPFGGPGAAAAAERAAKTVGLGSGPAFTQVSQGAAERIAVSGIAPTEPHGASSRRPTTGLRARQRLAAVAAGMLAASVLVAGFGAWALHTSRLPRAAPEPGASAAPIAPSPPPPATPATPATPPSGLPAPSVPTVAATALPAAEPGKRATPPSTAPRVAPSSQPSAPRASPSQPSPPQAPPPSPSTAPTAPTPKPLNRHGE